MNMSHIIVVFVIAVIVIFFVIGVILAPTVDRSVEDQQKFVATFSPGILKTEVSPFSTLTCLEKVQVGTELTYKYEAELRVVLTDPEEEVDDIDVMVIGFLDDNTFAPGKRSDGKVSVIEFPYFLEGEVKLTFFTDELQDGILHLTFWKWEENGCVGKNLEKKESLLKLVDACPEEYIYAGFLHIDKALDNSAC